MLLFMDSYRQSVEVHRELNAKHALASYTKAFFSSVSSATNDYWYVKSTVWI